MDKAMKRTGRRSRFFFGFVKFVSFAPTPVVTVDGICYFVPDKLIVAKELIFHQIFDDLPLVITYKDLFEEQQQ
jgi:hypothetical protein